MDTLKPNLPIHIDAAKRELQAARKVIEAKTTHNKATALEQFAEAAKDDELLGCGRTPARDEAEGKPDVRGNYEMRKLAKPVMPKQRRFRQIAEQVIGGAYEAASEQSSVTLQAEDRANDSGSRGSRFHGPQNRAYRTLLEDLPLATLQRLIALSRAADYDNDLRRAFINTRWQVRNKHLAVNMLSARPDAASLRNGLEIAEKIGAQIDRAGWWSERPTLRQLLEGERTRSTHMVDFLRTRLQTQERADVKQGTVRVECHGGDRGEETPRRFHLAGRTIEVVEVLACWTEPEARLFRVRGEDGQVYVFRLNERERRWEIPEVARRTGPAGS